MVHGFALFDGSNNALFFDSFSTPRTGNNQVNVTVGPPVPNYAGSTNTAITVNATRPQLPILSSLWQNNAFNVGGDATAIISGNAGSGDCLVGLGKQQTTPGGDNNYRCS